MKTSSSFLFAVLAGVLEWMSCGTAAEPARPRPEALILSGSDWFIHEDGRGTGDQEQYYSADPKRRGWLPAQVPGNIQSDLETAHVLRPIWYGEGDPALAQAAQKDWWYRKDFFVPESFAGQRVRLVFEGVDHECQVYLNGQQLGEHAGMYKRFGFDVAALVKPGETNQLAVLVYRIPDPLVPILASADAKGGPNVGTASNAIREYLKELKSPANQAWDWSIGVYTLGVWKGVRMEATGPAFIEWTQVQTDLQPDHQQATVRVRLEIDSTEAVEAKAAFRIRGHGAQAAQVAAAQLKGGKNVVACTLALDRPALWWPNGQGEQPLYELETELTETDSERVLDRRVTHFGVREIRWEQVEKAPADFLNPFRMLVNGRPIREMGSNILPPDALFGRIGQRGPRLLELAKAAGINTLRVWGGGVTFPEEIYARADEAGIMLLHELPLANCWPETNAVFLAHLEATVTDIVKQLRNHACIVEWSGGNEMPWQQGSDHPALHVLEKVMREQDNRIFRATEPVQGSGPHGTFTYVYHTEPAPYLSWLGAGIKNLYQVYNDFHDMRLSEFGTHSPANLEVWQREIPPSSQWPLDPEDPVLIRKNVFYGAALAQNWLHPEIAESLFGPFDGLAPLVRAGQFLGAEGLRYAMDELRRKGKTIGGFMSWDFNEPWPNGAGSYMVDYDGRPLMNFDFVRQALAAISLALRYDSILYDPTVGVDAELCLVSDAPEPARDLRWSWTARDRRGRVIGTGEGRAAVDPQSVARLGRINVRPPQATARGPVFIELQVNNSRGERLGERVHVFGASNVAGPLGGLIRNGTADADDPVLVSDSTPADAHRLVRVLWIQDWQDGRYDALRAKCQRELGVRFTAIPAETEALKKAAPDADTLARDFDVVWLGEGDYRKPQKLAVRLGTESLQVLADAVRNGVGLGTEGGWGGYADAGLDASPLAAVLPVVFSLSGESNRLAGGALVASTSDHPLAKGRLAKNLPSLPGCNPLTPKAGASTILKTASGASVLTTGSAGQGRVLAYAGGTAGGWAIDAWRPFPAFVGRLLYWLAGQPDEAVGAIGESVAPEGLPFRPVRRTSLIVSASPCRVAGQEEVMALTLKNTGVMTALFCAPEPLIEYRTDLLIENNHCCIPPGESRTVTVRAPIASQGGLSLSQTGWRITCWNADEVRIEPAGDVLLALGRRDAMCREFLGYGDVAKIAQPPPPVLNGRLANPSLLPALLLGAPENEPQRGPARFTFDAVASQTNRPSRLRIHTADRHRAIGPVVEVVVNGRSFTRAMPTGGGLQNSDPAQLAYPATAEFQLPDGTLRQGENTLEVRVKNASWFSWDSMDLVVADSLEAAVQSLERKSPDK